MLDTLTPIGTSLRIPESVDEDQVHLVRGQWADAVSFYETQGYVVLRGLIPRELCERVRQVFAAEVRPSRTPILRQKNMQYERNVFDADGFLKNPIFNVQDLGSGDLGGFRRAVLDILTYEATAEATAALLGTSATKLIQSMFFQAPAGTWAHQDSYYQDSATGLGNCVAGWFALEDIDAGAGRFYVCPGSHRSISPLRNEGQHNFATGHEAYQQAMLKLMRDNGLTMAAPFLAQGDVLFWNSLTVHGSLPAGRPGVSRTSLTGHYLRASDPMLQFHTRIRDQKMVPYNGMPVGLMHDMDELKNRLVRDAAANFPKTYRGVRKAAIRAVLAKQAVQKSLGL